MVSKKQPRSAVQPDFVLKHRIAGAAFLLFFGALFLPWLLGPPSEAIKLPESQASVQDVVADSVETEEDLLLAIENEQLTDRERVYISKITPLDSEREATANAQSTGTLAGSEIEGENTTGSSERQTTEPTASNPQTSEPAAQTTAKPSQVNNAESAAVTSNVPSGSSTVAAADKVDVGWIVQVGVFTDKRGAARVVADLRDKGFDPSTSIVDTNRGKATGTRIWLGPYAQRVNAAKAKSLLTSKTGEAGFIRAYP